MPYLNPRVLDSGLSVLTGEVNKLTICSQEPANYTEGNATYALGAKTSASVGSPGDASPNGRKVTVAAVTDGAVTATDTATHWALLDTANSRLLAAGALSSPQAVSNGNTFTLGTFDIRIPDPA